MRNFRKTVNIREFVEMGRSSIWAEQATLLICRIDIHFLRNIAMTNFVNNPDGLPAVNLQLVHRKLLILCYNYMRKTWREIISINTTPPEERVELLKATNDIKEMASDSEEICKSDLLKWNCKRPAKLEHLTLADWAAWYDRSGKPYVKPMTELDPDGLPLELKYWHLY